MTTIRMEAQGLRELIDAIGGMTPRVEAELSKAVNATGLELRTDIIRRYNTGPKTGRKYRKYNPRRVHQASAPGESPATDQGRLAGSVVFRPDGPLAVEVESLLAKARYAQALEFGTSRIRPRPAWRPAIAKLEPAFLRRVREAVERATA